MDKPLTEHLKPDGTALSLREYEAGGGYEGLRKALRLPPRNVQDEVTRSGLEGRGGAGFSTGKKWSFVPMGPEAARPKYFVANADEMEPGTFKDRLLIERNPHMLLEGLLIGAYAIEASEAYIFLRQEYKLPALRLMAAIEEATAAGYIGPRVAGSEFACSVHLHSSAGRYMCGEETGLLNALEGKRARPRSKPPFPQVSGLWGKPTIVNNVETLCCVPHILSRGAEWFRNLSAGAGGGTKIYGVSGRVKNPGLWELPLGVPLGEILQEYAGGMRGGYEFRGVLPGGASTEFMTSEHFGVKMDFEGPQGAGSRLGTGTMIVLDDQTCPVGMVLNLMRFFAHESCGWCTPCREGLPWAVEVLSSLEAGQGRLGDLELLEEMTWRLGPGMTFCALAPGAMEPLDSALRYFRKDFEAHVRDGKCPWKGRS